MDSAKLVEALRATIDINQRQQAEEHLHQVHKIIGFAPTLLQVIMMNDVEMPVRQAGVIYLKNMITQNWADREVEPGQPLPFSIHEQDRGLIRDSIVDAVILAPDLIRVQLGICVQTIVKHDFPGRWTGIVDKISIFLQNPDSNTWMGALVCLYQLVKNYEYKKPEDRAPLTEAMHLLLPMVYQRAAQLTPDHSEPSVALLKQILKTFYALIQYFLPLDLVSKESFSLWMELVQRVVNSPIPEHTNQVEEEERPDLVWWKCKKWACHILSRIFERYGSPGNVSREYHDFSEYYIKTFTNPVLETLLKVLETYRQGVYVSPRVLQLTMSYLQQGVSHAVSWKLLKPHINTIIQEVVFPLLCYNQQDEELWENDPHEYIRLKFDIFEDFVSPVVAARVLFHEVTKKRKGQLMKAMQFVLSILTNGMSLPKQKDGALHMVGAVADILRKKEVYKEQMETMLVTYVFPEFVSPHGYLRARACWVLHHFSEVRIKNEQNLVQAVTWIQQCLLNDKDLPVKVEAAVALQALISNQEKVQKLLEPTVTDIALELLKVIRETENDDLTTVMQKLVYTYTEQLAPIAVQMTQHLALTFTQVLESEDGSEEKTIAAMGILTTMETILTVMEEQKEIMDQLEKILLNVIGLVLTESVLEFYEEVMSLVYQLTCKNISPDMWKVFEMMYQMFQKEGTDYFTDMMPALHNYVTVDTPAFVSNENHLLAMFNMVKTILSSSAGEDAECHAAKLLEVIILQCKGQIDQCIPTFVQTALERLMREVKTSELRTMLLQVVIAALYYNPMLLLQSLQHIILPSVNGSIAGQFIKQWMHDTDCFLGLHDRKLCVLGLCTLLGLGPNRPQELADCTKEVVPSLLLLFTGLKRAYATKAQNEEDSDEDDDEDEAFDPGDLESDEDDIDDEGDDYMERLDGEHSSDDDSEDDDEDGETALETYTTPLDADDCPIDEFIIFKDIMLSLQQTEPALYAALTSHLNPEQLKSLHDVFVYADQRKAAAESKRIEQSGGYVFQNQTVPMTFNFGGSLS